MDESREHPPIPGFLDIKEAARLLGVAESSIYRYVQAGRLTAYHAGQSIMVEEKSVKDFQPSHTGRPRKRHASWRVSPDTSSFLVSYICATVKEGTEEQLKAALLKIRQQERHLFPGTVARYVSLDETVPPSVTIQLVWKSTEMPDEKIRQQELAALQNELADVLDWSTTQVREGTVLLHT